jgi:hypothetical protein
LLVVIFLGLLCAGAYYAWTAVRREIDGGESGCPDRTERAGLKPPNGFAEWCEFTDERGDRLKQGPYKAWHSNGAVLETGRYRRGKRSDEWRAWLPDGKLQAVGSFTHGCLKTFDDRDGKSCPDWKDDCGNRLFFVGDPTDFWTLARWFDVSTTALAQANGMVPAARLGSSSVSGCVMIPPAGQTFTGEAVDFARTSRLGTNEAAHALLLGDVGNQWIAAAASSAAFTGTLTWPVKDGWLARRYASDGEGYRAGLDIAGASFLSDVHAASAGVVA